MVDFRYHLVSIVAIFLALAIGIVLGTNVLSGDVLDNLKHQTSDLRGEAQGLREKVSEQAGQLAQQQNFIDSLESTIVARRLTGQRIVLVTAPGVAGSVRSNLSDSLELAGAKVTGTVELQQAYFAADQRELLDSVARSRSLPEVNVADGAGTYQRAAAQIAGALVTPPTTPLPGAVLPLSSGASGLLAALEDDGFVKLTSAPSVVSTMAVVLVPAAPKDPTDADTQAGGALVLLASALERASGGALMAGVTHSADDGGAVAALRGSGAVGEVSGVDDVDVSQGRIAVVLALQGALDGHAGQYGIGPGARAGGPTPLPRPVASPSPPSGLPQVPGALPSPAATGGAKAAQPAPSPAPAGAGAGL